MRTGKFSSKIFNIAILVFVLIVAAACFTVSRPEPTPIKVQQVSIQYGDVADDGDTKINSKGVYGTVSFKPRSESELLSNDNISELDKFGYSKDDIKSAKQFLQETIVEDFIDSTAINGNEEDYQKWVESLDASKKYSTDVIQGFKTNSSNGKSAVFFVDKNSVVPVFVYDKKPRVNDVSFKGSTATAYEYNKVPYMEIVVKYDTSYRVNDKQLLSYVSKNTGLKKESEIEQIIQPQVFDNKGENSFKVQAETTFQLMKQDDAWIIAGFDISFVFNDASYRVSDNKL